MKECNLLKSKPMKNFNFRKLFLFGLVASSLCIISCTDDEEPLAAPEARSRAGGCHFLTNKAGTTFNGPTFALAKVIKRVMSSAAEAELAASQTSLLFDRCALCLEPNYFVVVHLSCNLMLKSNFCN